MWINRLIASLTSSREKDFQEYQQILKLRARILGEMNEKDNGYLNEGITQTLLNKGHLTLHHGQDKPTEITLSDGLDHAELEAIRKTLGKKYISIKGSDVYVLDESPQTPLTTPSLPVDQLETGHYNICGIRG